PMASTASMPKWLWGLIGGGVLLVGVLIFLVIKLLAAKPPVQAPANPPTIPTTAPGTATQPGVIAKTEEKKPEEKKPEEAKPEEKGHAKIASASPGGKHHKADPKQVQKDLDLMKPAEKGSAPPPTP